MRTLTYRRAGMLTCIVVAAMSAVLLLTVGMGWQPLADAAQQLAISMIVGGGTIFGFAVLQAWISRNALRDER